MNTWVLRVELNGEWEQCAFGTQQEALASFKALAADYSLTIARAVLYRRMGPEKLTGQKRPEYIN